MARRPSLQQADLQSSTPSLQQGECPVDTARRTVQIGEEFPAIADAHFVARLFGKSVGQIHRMRMQGRLDAFLLKGVRGPARFNGFLLKAWSEGTLDQTHINGQLDRPRSFGIGSRGGSSLRALATR